MDGLRDDWARAIREPAETTPGEVSFEVAAPNDAAILVLVKNSGQGGKMDDKIHTPAQVEPGEQK